METDTTIMNNSAEAQSSAYSQLQNLIDQMEPLAKGPIHLPLEHAIQRVLPCVLVTVVLATVVYCASFPLARRLIRDSSTSTSSNGSSSSSSRSSQNNQNHGSPEAAALLLQAKQRRLCYQITNSSINLILGLLGCYFEYNLLPQNPTLEESTQGQEDFYIFGAMQVGYQLWGLFVGTFYVHERLQMMFHHLAVICVGSMVAFFNNGFRYWTPYFFGIFELSSVPLGVMNAFKDNREWIQEYPSLFFHIRTVFAISFLTIRCVMLIPRLVYLRDLFLVAYLMDPKHTLGYRGLFFVVWISSCFLFFLQLYWAYLIVFNMVKVLSKRDKKEKTK